MSDVVPFSFENHEVRVIRRDGEPWWVLADVCRVLGIGNTADASRRLDEDEKHGVDIIDPIGRPQNATAINESGLYSLVLTSRKPEAKRFKKWVTAEVLPAIRKTGGYGATPALDLRDPAQLAVVATQLSEINRELQGRVAELETEKVELVQEVGHFRGFIRHLGSMKAEIERMMVRMSAGPNAAPEETPLALPSSGVDGYIAVLDMLREMDVPQAGRQPLVSAVTSLMKQHSLYLGAQPIPDPRRMRLLFRKDVAADWLMKGGEQVIKNHLDSVASGRRLI